MAQTELEQLLFTMDANITRLSKKMDDANGKVDKATRQMERRAQAASKELERHFSRGFDRVGAAATVAFLGISAYAVKVASDARELQATFEIAFQGGVDRAEEFAKVLADKVGRSVTDIKSGMTDLKLVLNGLGVEGEQGLKMVELLSGRGLDIAAQRNVTDAEAMRAIISAITGETEPMKRFGAVINETAVKAELLRLGFKGNAQEASEAAKAVARANLILARTSDAMGTAERESGELANQVKRAQGEFKEAARALGEQLLPAATDATKATTELIQKFAELPSGVQLAALALLGLAAASGPIMTTVKALQALIVTAGGARVALAGLGLSGATGAIGATAGTVGLVGGGLYLAARDGSRADKFNAVRNNLGKATGDDLAWAQSYVAEQRKRFKYGAPEGVDTKRLNTELEEFDRVIAGELSRRQRALEQETLKKIKQESDDAAKQALAGIQLSEGQTTGNGTGGAGKKSRIDTAQREADRIAAAQETLRIEEAIEAAKASGDKEALRVAERARTEAQLRRDYEDAYGKGTAKAAEMVEARLRLEDKIFETTQRRETLETKIAVGIQKTGEAAEKFARDRQRVADLARDELDYRMQIARLQGDEKGVKAAERELYVMQRIAELRGLGVGEDDAARKGMAQKEADALDDAEAYGKARETFSKAFAEGLRALASGDLQSFAENMAGSFTQKLIEDGAGQLYDLIFGGGKAAVEGATIGAAASAGITGAGTTVAGAFGTSITAAGKIAAKDIAAAVAAAGGGEGGGVASALDMVKSLSAMIGGGRATGGRVNAGTLYQVNDGGGPKEFFAPAVNGTIMTAAQINQGVRSGLAAVAQRSGGGDILRVEVDKSDLFDVKVRRISAPMAQQAGVAGAEGGSIKAQTAIAKNQRRLIP